MRAATATRPKDCRSNSSCEERRNLPLLAGTRPEPQHRRASQVVSGSQSFAFKESVYAAKQNFVLQLRSPAVFSRSRSVLTDKELARSARSKQFNAYEDGSNHDRVNAVHSDGVDQMHIRQRLAARPAKVNVSAESLRRTTGLDSPHHIPLHHLLVFKAYVGLRKNTCFLQAPQRLLRQRETAMREQVWFLRHVFAFTPTVEQV